MAAPLLCEVPIQPDTAEAVSLGQTVVFPPEAIAAYGLDLSRRLGCHVPTTECEAAVVSLALALRGLGWRVFRPETDPRS